MNENHLKRLFPNASPQFIAANTDSHTRLSTPHKEQSKGSSLECATQRKDEGLPCFAIRFIVYSTYPPDWDNPWIKTIQDALRNASILHDDAWDVLEGSVVSRKAHSKEEERLEIEIYNQLP